MKTKLLATVVSALSYLSCLWPVDVQTAAMVQAIGDQQVKTGDTIFGITAANDVQAVLEAARRALGGRDRLQRVRSIHVKGTLTIGGIPNDSLERLLLLPGSFKEIRGGITFTLAGEDYWQRPEPTPPIRERAHKATRSTFIELCLVWLMRVPAAYPLKASWTADAAPGTQEVFFEGPDGFKRVVVFDPATHRPLEYRSTTVLTQGDTTLGQRTRRVSIDDYRELDGLRLPRRLTMRQAGMHGDFVYEFQETRVNERVGPADFVQR